MQRLEKENAQLKDLYKDGLIARLAVEASKNRWPMHAPKVKPFETKLLQQINHPWSGILRLRSLQAISHGQRGMEGRWPRSLLRQYGVDSYLIFCLMSQESSFSSNAVSPKGAQGLMQLMPGTAARYGVTNPYDVSQSIMGGTRYLRICCSCLTEESIWHLPATMPEKAR